MEKVIINVEQYLSQINGRLRNIEANSFNIKKVLNMNDVCKYTGLSKSYIYKLTMNSEIPHYKPTGKCIFFDRDELENWLLANRILPNDEVVTIANEYCLNNKVGRI